MSKRSRGPAHIKFHPQAWNVATRLNDCEVLRQLKRSFDRASEIAYSLRECTTFEFMGHDESLSFREDDPASHALTFWIEVSMLLNAAIRTGARAVQNVIDAITWSVGSRNETLFALSCRSLLEHAAGFQRLHSRLREWRQRLVEEIWPGKASDTSYLVADSDLSMRKELVVFVGGARCKIPEQSFPAVTDSIGAWERFAKQAKEDNEHLQSSHVMTDISSMMKLEGQHQLCLVYDILSEYCHPNSASRTLDCRKRINSFGRYTISISDSSELSPGFCTLFSLCRELAAPSCRSIDETLDFLVACRKPMPAIHSLQVEPPIGGMPAIDEHGRRHFVRMGQAAPLLPEILQS